jgi:flagellar hook-associated protein 2
VQSTQYAPDTIQLNDGTNNLLTSLNTGSYVTYQVNGQPSTPVNSTSRTLSISTGLTANVLTAGTANITVSQSNANVSSAISSFVTAYNSATAELTKNRGQNGGALTGNSLVLALQTSLNSLGSYASSSGTSSAVSSLSDLGLTFDQSGNLNFDSATFDAISSSSPAAVNTFLGSETGSGFIQSAYSTLTSLTDGTKGTITVAGNNIGTSITSLTTEISNKQDQVNQLQTNLTTQMAQADAAISSLQGQLSEITGLFSAENQVSQNINGVG